MSKQEIERIFPKLLINGYSLESSATPQYNCIAWAAGETKLWWEPDPLNLNHWPPGIPRIYTLDAYIKVYEILGYTVCHDAKYENNFEKVAIYVDSNGKPTHAARQLSSGKWTSKLGELEDIDHATVDCLVGLVYGSVAVILKRLKSSGFTKLIGLFFLKIVHIGGKIFSYFLRKI